MSNKHYTKWTAEEEAKLVVMYHMDMSMVEMSEGLSRTESAINARITKLRKEGRIIDGDAHLQQELPLDATSDEQPVKRFLTGLDTLTSEVEREYASDWLPYVSTFVIGFVVGALTMVIFGG